MSRAATRLAGNASSIFQAWLDLKRQTSPSVQSHGTRGQATSGTGPGKTA